MIETESLNKVEDIVSEAEAIAEISNRRRRFGRSFARFLRKSSDHIDKASIAQELIRAGSVSSPTIGRQIGRIFASKGDFNHYLNPLLVSMEVKRKEVF